ncbi:MAG TPA: inverse autotransporter beta domain-containing protein, partial [Gammaproteobacteria bacterium]|nr:inverse autotransporter beta domain-containing protein [Gammaproteobacteria bacterium]
MKSHQIMLSGIFPCPLRNPPHFKRAALALAITAALTPMAVPATEWNRNIEVYLMPSTQGRLLYGGALLQPIWQDNQSLLYGDLRGTITQTDGKDTEFNFGLGYRWLTPQRDWILGGYAAFDTRDTLNDNRFNQFTFGVEALGDMYDARFNYYAPITDEKRLDTALDGGLFQAHTLFANGIYEEALQGFDGEVGVRIPWIDFAETRVYLGGYHFDGSVTPKAADGVKGRIEMRLMQDISVGVSAQSDDLFGGETMLQLRYSFGYPNVNRKRTVPERMIQFVERDIDIKATDRLGSVDGLHGSFHGVESGNDDMGHKVTVSTSVFHIDNTAAAGGDGSFEHPYNTITSCLAGGCAMPSTFVYV